MIIKDFVGLIFPEVCIHCNTPTVRGEDFLCTRCMLDLPIDANQQLLMSKFGALQHVSFAFSYLKFSKKGIVQTLLHQLKYEGNREVGSTLGKWFGADIAAAIAPLAFEIIIPVPIHQNRERTRGYNQSDLIAKGLSETIDVPWSNKIARRIRKTKTQTSKGKVERWQNVDGIFQVIHPDLIANKKVIVVDDVVTTGATTSAFAETILEAGAKEIGILAIARAD